LEKHAHKWAQGGVPKDLQVIGNATS
jgi:hypothetical protein